MTEQNPFGRERIKAAAQGAVQKATSREFLTGEGRIIQQHLNRLIQPEVTFARTQPELFVLPATAKVNLDSLPGDDQLLFAEPAQEFVDTFANPFREVEIDLDNFDERPTTGIIFKSTPLTLANNEWRTLALSLNSDQRKIYPDINFEQAASGFRAEMYKDEFSEEVMRELYKALVKSYGDEEALDSELDKAYEDHSLERAYGNHMALLQLVEFPDSITTMLPPDLALSPDRLMTDEEYQKWENFVDSLRVNPKTDDREDLDRQYRAFPGTDVPILHEVWSRTGDEITYTPLEVLDGKERLGWQIGEVLQFPNWPLKARFSHGDKTRLYVESITSSDKR